MRLTIRRRAALLAVGAMTAGLLLTAPQQATAGPPNLLSNPSFETAGAAGSDMPSCWSRSGWGDNDFTFATVADAHSGTKAMKVSLTRRVDGDRKALVTENATCAPGVTPGRQYDLSAWYKSNTPDVSVTVFRHDTTAGWQYWTDLQNPPVSAAWARTEVRTPAVRPIRTRSHGGCRSTGWARSPPTTTRWRRWAPPRRSRSARVRRRSAPRAGGR